MAAENLVVNLSAPERESSKKVRRREKFLANLQEWEKFVGGENNVDRRSIPRDIQDSWRRCRALGLDPFGAPQQRILTKEKFHALFEKNRKLVEISKFFLAHYHHLISLTSFVVSFFDPRGYLLEIRVAERFQKSVSMVASDWVPGSLWNEETVGTTAVGMAIKTKKPSFVFGPQHYLKRSHGATGYSAPIFDPDGTFLGGVILWCRYDRSNTHAFGMTIAAAHLIENQLKINQSLEEVKAAFVRSEIAKSYQQTVMASIPEALIAIDNKGLITLINDPARKIPAFAGKEVIGSELREILGQQNRQISSLIEKNDHLVYVEVRISCGKSWSEYTLTCNPILSSSGGEIGKILILTEIKRVKKLVANMIGAKANFTFDVICGRDPKFLDTVEQAKLASRSRSNVLLLGPSGVGKDVYAQAIHNASDRTNAPYVAINCGAIPRDLMASELFGHEEGAFTGARRGGNQGKFELAEGGTIFLDEIGEMPLEMQPVLLRVIEDKCIIRIGGARARQVDVRIIAATNKDLLEEVYKGNFRKDLYYRLNVFTIHLLPLRERPDDIPLLLDYFVGKYSQALGKRIDRTDRKVLEFFRRYEWPGNVRELQNVVERMMNCVQTNLLSADLIPLDMTCRTAGMSSDFGTQSAKDFERQTIAKLMEMNLSKSEIAKKMGINLSTLYRKLNRYNGSTSETESSREPWKRSDEVGLDHVGTSPELSEEQADVLRALDMKRGITELMGAVRRTNRTKFRNQVLAPLLAAGLVEMTIPEKPNSSNQKYRLTKKGRDLHGDSAAG